MHRVIIHTIMSMLLLSFTAEASIRKSIPIGTTPHGAKVYAMRGTNRQMLGTTPFHYDAEFHSEQSVLRLSIEKAGYKSQSIKLTAAQNYLNVELFQESYAIKPEAVDDPHLRTIAARLVPFIDGSLRSVFVKHEHLGLNANDLITPKRIGEAVYLHIPLLSSNISSLMAGRAAGDQIAVSYSVWNEIVYSILASLNERSVNLSGIDAIIVDVFYDERRRAFKVDRQIESRIEMECVAGYKMVQRWNHCKTRSPESRCSYTSGTQSCYTEYRCVAGMESQQVRDPCVRRVPRTKQELKFNPSVKNSIRPSQIRYVLGTNDLKVKSSAEALYGVTAIVHVGKDAMIIEQQGTIPEELGL